MAPSWVRSIQVRPRVVLLRQKHGRLVGVKPSQPSCARRCTGRRRREMPLKDQRLIPQRSYVRNDRSLQCRDLRGTQPQRRSHLIHTDDEYVGVDRHGRQQCTLRLCRTCAGVRWPIRVRIDITGGCGVYRPPSTSDSNSLAATALNRPAATSLSMNSLRFMGQSSSDANETVASPAHQLLLTGRV